MERRSWFGAFIGVLLLAVFGYAGWRTFGYSHADECYACNRPIHAHSKTVAMVNGRARLFCCPACALSQHEQAGKPIRITQLTSFLDGETLSPENAFLVKGSNVNMCQRTTELMADDKRPVDLRYDRCAPSLIAFSQRGDANEFAQEHGGEVAPFTEMAAAFAK